MTAAAQCTVNITRGESAGELQSSRILRPNGCHVMGNLRTPKIVVLARRDVNRSFWLVCLIDGIAETGLHKMS